MGGPAAAGTRWPVGRGDAGNRERQPGRRPELGRAPDGLRPLPAGRGAVARPRASRATTLRSSAPSLLELGEELESLLEPGSSLRRSTASPGRPVPARAGGPDRPSQRLAALAVARRALSRRAAVRRRIEAGTGLAGARSSTPRARRSSRRSGSSGRSEARPRGREPPRSFVPALVLACLVWAVGEGLGYLRGEGADDDRRMLEYEQHKSRYTDGRRERPADLVRRRDGHVRDRRRRARGRCETSPIPKGSSWCSPALRRPASARAPRAAGRPAPDRRGRRARADRGSVRGRDPGGVRAGRAARRDTRVPRVRGARAAHPRDLRGRLRSGRARAPQRESGDGGVVGEPDGDLRRALGGGAPRDRVRSPHTTPPTAGSSFSRSATSFLRCSGSAADRRPAASGGPTLLDRARVGVRAPQRRPASARAPPTGFMPRAAMRRSRSGSWSPARRALYAAAAPLIPLVMAARVVRSSRLERRIARRSLAGVFLPLAVNLAALGAGELAAYVAGAGSSPERIIEYEIHRARHL